MILILTLTLICASSGPAAVIFTRLLDSPSNFVSDPIELDFDNNGSMDLGFRMRSLGYSSLFFEVLIPDNTAVVEQGSTSLANRGTNLDSRFVIDSLAGRPLFNFYGTPDNFEADFLNLSIGLHNSFDQDG